MAGGISDFAGFSGRTTQSFDVVTASQVARLAATLDIEPPATQLGDPLPPGWHAIFFGAPTPGNRLRIDGLPGGSHALPDIGLRRHRVGLDTAEYRSDLRIGDEIQRVSSVVDIACDDVDRVGPVVRVLHRSEIASPRGLCVVEERESIYSDAHVPASLPTDPLPPPAWTKVIEPNPILLFRISALRFNSHRVHYDRDYATRVEGLPGLVIQAALIELLLLEMCRAQASHRIEAFRARTHVQIHDTGPFRLCGAPQGDGTGATMWAIGPQDELSLVGHVAFAR
jgi:3-methylfumaryl-CoA hydratase